MATREHIFLSAGGGPEEVASWLAVQLGMTVKHDDHGNVYVSRPAYAHSGEIVARVRDNVVADPAPGPGEESLIDAFTAMLDLDYSGHDEEIRLDEAKRLFVALSAKSSSPIALLAGLDLLIGVANPGTGPVWLPPATTPEFEHRDLWMPYRPARG